MWMRYSVKSVCPRALAHGHLYHDQLQAHAKVILNPPLGWKGKMEPGDQTTVDMRNRTISQFVGFCYSKLGMSPNITHVMNPVAVSAACGFWKARGLAPATIKLRVQHIVQAVPFAHSKYCPKQQEWSQAHITQMDEWCKKLSAKALSDYQRSPKKGFNVHLQESWDFAREDWIKFLVAFQVDCTTTTIEGHASTTHANGKEAFHLQDNDYKWSPKLAQWCQTAVLRILLCGLYQPPVRAGALRVLMSNSQILEDCVCEKCK